MGGRPEVILEGSDLLEKGWKEYEFLYKPGNVSARLPVVGTSASGFSYTYMLFDMRPGTV